jgi:hypothetical protein
MTQILSAAQLPTDLPNFSIGTYPVEPIALQIAEAFAQSREKNEVVTWTFGGFIFAIDAQQNRIELIPDQEHSCTYMISKARRAAREIKEPVTLCWQNWETEVSPAGDAVMTLLFGADIEASLQEARLLAKELAVPVEVISGNCTLTVWNSTKVREAVKKLIVWKKRSALSDLIEELPAAIESGAPEVIAWIGKLANQGSDNADLIDLLGVTSTISLSNLNLCDLDNGFVGAAVWDLSAFGSLAPNFISEAEAFYAERTGTIIEICQNVAVAPNLSLKDAWNEALVAARLHTGYVRFTHGDQTYYTDSSRCLVADIPVGANFQAAFYLAWLAVGEVEDTVTFYWSGHKFTLNTSREIVLFSAYGEPLNNSIDLALDCTRSVVEESQDKQFILNARGFQIKVSPTSDANDLRAWILNQLCAGPCHSITD